MARLPAPDGTRIQHGQHAHIAKPIWEWLLIFKSVQPQQNFGKSVQLTGAVPANNVQNLFRKLGGLDFSDSGNPV